MAPPTLKELHDHLYTKLYNYVVGEVNDAITRHKVCILLLDECHAQLPATFKIDVVCDEINNPPSVVDAKELRARVYITTWGPVPSFVNILELAITPRTLSFPVFLGIEDFS